MAQVGIQPGQSSYRQRQARLDVILDGFRIPSGVNRFDLSTNDDPSLQRDLKVDYLLARGWLRGSASDVNDLAINERDFSVLADVARGQFGSVAAVRCAFDGKVYAMKSIRKIDALRSLNLSLPIERHLHMHAGFAGAKYAVPLVAAFQTESEVHLVLPFAAFGSLWDRMQDLRPFAQERVATWQQSNMEESEIKWWARQMTDSIAWLHDLGFVHRDIKPHNWLIFDAQRLVLTDFGSAAHLSVQGNELSCVPRNLCQIPVGTPDYVAPEVLLLAEEATMQAMRGAAALGDTSDDDKILYEKGYGANIDCWSLGCVLYELAFELPPFFAEGIDETCEKIKSFADELSIPRSGHSDDLVRFIRRPLKRSSNRCTIKELCTDAWLSSATDQPAGLNSLLTLRSVDISAQESITYETLDPPQQQDQSSVENLRGDSDVTAMRRFLGFTFQPSPDYFENQDQELQGSCTPFTGTPKFRPISDASTVRRSTSTRRSNIDMLECVQQSARKQLTGRIGLPRASQQPHSESPTSPSLATRHASSSLDSHHNNLVANLITLQRSLAELKLLSAQ